MKRRNFLSGLLAAPLALKARLARLFGPKPVELCNARIGNLVLRMQPETRSRKRVILALQQGQSLRVRIFTIFHPGVFTIIHPPPGFAFRFLAASLLYGNDQRIGFLGCHPISGRKLEKDRVGMAVAAFSERPS